jgi:DNA-binding MarR family transcriptional regulator
MTENNHPSEVTVSAPADQDIFEHFEFFMQRSMREMMGSMKQSGLSMPQIYTLMYLYHEGEVRISDIAVLMEVGKAAASQLVDRLVQQGLIERVEDEQDRRARKIRLLPKSLTFLDKGFGVHRQQMQRIFASLSPEKRAAVQTAFRYLMEAMHNSGRPDGENLP